MDRLLFCFIYFGRCCFTEIVDEQIVRVKKSASITKTSSASDNMPFLFDFFSHCAHLHLKLINYTHFAANDDRKSQKKRATREQKQKKLKKRNLSASAWWYRNIFHLLTGVFCWREKKTAKKMLRRFHVFSMCMQMMYKKLFNRSLHCFPLCWSSSPSWSRFVN